MRVQPSRVLLLTLVSVHPLVGVDLTLLFALRMLEKTRLETMNPFRFNWRDCIPFIRVVLTVVL
jgi:hypothetical protein